MNLTDTLQALGPAAEAAHITTPVSLVYRDGWLYVGNGTIYARVPIELACDNFIVNAERFKKVWQEGSKLSVQEEFLVITRGRRRFQVQLQDEPLDYLDVPEAEDQLEPEFLDALRMAGRFASANAIYPWACGVMAKDNFLVATNNMTLVRVAAPLPVGYHVTFHRMALDLLATGEAPCMGYNDRCMFFKWPNGVRMRTPMYEGEMPPSVWDMAMSLKTCDVPVGELNATLEDLRKIDGRFCFFADGKFAVDNGAEKAIEDIDFHGKFTFTVEAAKIVFPNATHIGFEDTPAKLRFARTESPLLVGIAAGSRYSPGER